MLKVLDLFSGIGGFSLGLERTGGFETVAFCEIDPFCRNVLKKHWPDVPIYEDVRTLDYGRAVDVITGGFPCQDLSSAGKQRGIVNGERSSLWGDMCRHIGFYRPKYAIIENVSALLNGESGYWFAKFLSDLASIGYDAEWHRISAADIGAAHIRERIWIIAYPSKTGRSGSIIKRRIKKRRDVGNEMLIYSDVEGIISWAKGEAKKYKNLCGKPCISRDDDGFSGWMDRVGALGNAVVPQIPEMIGYAILEAENE